MTNNADTKMAMNAIKIESFLNAATYQETIEVSANFNTRLCLERRLRLPFLDPQTGVAQKHSNLYAQRKQRLPGIKSGQVYTYPAVRWRKTARLPRPQTTANPCRSAAAQATATLNPTANMVPAIQSPASLPLVTTALLASNSSSSNSSSSNNNANNSVGANSKSYSSTATGGALPGATSGGFLVHQHDDNSNSNNSTEKIESFEADLDASRDTNNNNNSGKEEMARDWLVYDDDMDNDFDNYSEPKSADDEYDYDPRYGTKKRNKRASKRDVGRTRNGAEHRNVGSSGSTPKGRRPRGTAEKTRTRRRGGNAGQQNGSKAKAGVKFEEPPSFASAAAAMDSDHLFANPNSNDFDDHGTHYSTSTHTPYLSQSVAPSYRSYL